MKSTVVIACTVVVTAVLIGFASVDALNYTCYKCDSKTNPAMCSETFGSTDINVEKQTNCGCCRKQKASDIWTRSCETGTSCVPTVGDIWTCYGNLCNTAAPIKIQGFVVALMSALGLAVYFGY